MCNDTSAMLSSHKIYSSSVSLKDRGTSFIKKLISELHHPATHLPQWVIEECIHLSESDLQAVVCSPSHTQDFALSLRLKIPVEDIQDLRVLLRHWVRQL